MTYENLMMESEKYDLIIKEKDLPGYKGRIYKNRVGIRRNIPTVEKACVLAEELGHYHTTTGNILDQSKVENRKQEYHARLWAYNKQIGLMGIVRAYQYGCQNSYEMADYLGVTEEFLADALKAYKSKYGICATVDNYIVYFEPYVGIMEIKTD
ncbi:ImmA/IrrE family metallo-endopeptidase [Lachnospiraceae bacterium 46-15]